MMLVKIVNDEGRNRWIDPESVRLVFREDRDDSFFRVGTTVIVLHDGIEIGSKEPEDAIVTRINEELR